MLATIPANADPGRIRASGNCPPHDLPRQQGSPTEGAAKPAGVDARSADLAARPPAESSQAMKHAQATRLSNRTRSMSAAPISQRTPSSEDVALYFRLLPITRLPMQWTLPSRHQSLRGLVP